MYSDIPSWNASETRLLSHADDMGPRRGVCIREQRYSDTPAVRRGTTTL